MWESPKSNLILKEDNISKISIGTWLVLRNERGVLTLLWQMIKTKVTTMGVVEFKAKAPGHDLSSGWTCFKIEEIFDKRNSLILEELVNSSSPAPPVINPWAPISHFAESGSEEIHDIAWSESHFGNIDSFATYDTKNFLRKMANHGYKRHISEGKVLSLVCRSVQARKLTGNVFSPQLSSFKRYWGCAIKKSWRVRDFDARDYTKAICISLIELAFSNNL